MEQLIKKGAYLLDKLAGLGADSAQVSVSSGLTEEFNAESGEFTLIRSVYNSGASMKVIKDNRKGSTSVNDLSEETLDAAANDCIQLALSGVPDPDFTVAAFTENRDFVSGTLHCDKAAFFDSLIAFTEKAARDYPDIMIEQLSGAYSYGKQVIMNSNGVQYTEEDGNYSVSVMFSAHRGDETGSFNCVDFDYLDPKTDIMEFADMRESFERALEELTAVKSDEKFCGTAIFMPRCTADFADVIFSFTGTVPLIEKTSPWYGKLGEKVASDCFTLNVIPKDDRIVGGENVTADGYIAENYTMIENGVLKSYSIGEYGERKTGFPRAKSTSGAIEILPGEKTLAEIIASIDRGILVGRFSGGEPGANGDFSGVAKNSFLIKDGKIVCAVKETMISGNFDEMLKNVTAISKETLSDSSSVIPYIAFDGVTIA